MAKLFLKFEAAVLKEVTLSQGVVTIGRLPDNLVQVDNPAVSGHHAKIYWDTDHYVLEDNESTNGTYVNNRRITRVVLNDGDQVLVGKHTVLFKDAWHEDAPEEKTVTTAPPMQRMDATMMLDTRKAKEMMAQAQAMASGTHSAAAATPAAAATSGAPTPAPPTPAKERIGTLTVMSGKTDQRQYVLAGKLNVIGKSDMASIRLKGWFAPKVAAVINRRDNKYFIAASEKNIQVKINEAVISGQHELADGDLVEVAKIKMTFSLNE
jgi:pSer/pThr/pTyr-binding forkhead associated (FHA) protein